MRITRVYTRAGDQGNTRLGGGQSVSKDSLRIEAIGAVDELNASLGVVLAGAVADDLRGDLLRIQNDLFHLGADLCILEEDKASLPPLPRIEARHIERLERTIDRLQESLSPLEEFILPGGAPGAAHLHHARTICRRAERVLIALSRAEAIGPHLVPYLNRLSDLLFVMARRDNAAAGQPDVFWDKQA